jgi:hypothetical protein
MAELSEHRRAMTMARVNQCTVAWHDVVTDIFQPPRPALRARRPDNKQPDPALGPLFDIGDECIARQPAIHPPSRKVRADGDAILQRDVTQFQRREQMRVCRMGGFTHRLPSMS